MVLQPSMPVSQLMSRLPQAWIRGEPRTYIRGITHDSRLVCPDDMFVCLSGALHDGHRFASRAVAEGATALLVNEGGLEAVSADVPPEIAIVTVPDTRRALPAAACALFGDPSHSLTMVGVTGTNGKTTTTRMIAAILHAAGHRVGTIGTLGAELDGESLPSQHTTPEADQLQELLAQLRDDGASAVVMEVSSHALAQHRTDGIAFNAGVFTNLTQDHLDFHGSMDAYFSAKSRLFADYPVRYPRPDASEFVAAINTSDWAGRYLKTLARGVTVTFSSAADPSDIRAEHVTARPESTSFDAVYGAGSDEFRIPISLPIGGAFQVNNALAAAAACLGLGVDWETIANGLAALAPVPGRFESIETGDHEFSVVVDYAHTPDGLSNLLRSAKELSCSRILLVFGCGGDRDRAKRPLMGGVAASMANVAIVTSDNPRSEDPGAIIDEVLSGMRCGTASGIEIHVEPDRRKAIVLALEQAQPGDMVLIAGKGHEDYQIIGDQTLPFDDRRVAAEWLDRQAR